jgi:hypothetical protein
MMAIVAGAQPDHGGQAELQQAHQADADHLAQHELPRPDRGEQDLDDPAGLLLDHALGHHLPIQQDRDVDQDADDERQRDPGTLVLAGRLQIPYVDTGGVDGGVHRGPVAAKPVNLVVRRDLPGEHREQVPQVV